MNRKQLREEILLATYGATWADCLWYCLLSGTVGSAAASAVTSGAAHTVLSYVTVVGIGIMAALFVGWVIYGLLRFVIHHLAGGIKP